MKLSLILVVLVALGCQAMPQRRRLSQRQVEYASTPYPAAGFRPRIAFDLPKPKLETEPEPQSITTTTTPKDKEQEEVEDLTTTEEDLDLSLRTPASTYGAPPETNVDEVEDTVEIEAAPARDFQPPVLEAVEDFAANSIAGEQQPVADVPALEPQEESASETETEADTTLINTDEVELKAVTTPSNTYGPPLPTAAVAAAAGTPASTYGAPDLNEPTNELDDVDESQVELVDEAEQEQELTNELASGRLILLPLGPGGAQFGRLILAVEQPRQRQQKALRSERLRRI
ncbi:protein phosphatase 1 regulatory subunit 37 [Drosophila tropicalis]|uniref:protein phosphatase 1 regulatory subunit 37 n=1 Tax=Drosophila tropicalis TaxID=46794 RepID=UPI0035AB9005